MTPSKISVFLNRNQFHPKFKEAWIAFDKLRAVRRSINLTEGERHLQDCSPLDRLEALEVLPALRRIEALRTTELNGLIEEIKTSMN